MMIKNVIENKSIDTQTLSWNNYLVKICILAYWYEPMQAVGALRAESFYKYAGDSDVDAFVVTVEPNTRYTTSVDKDCPNDAKIFRIPGFNANA